MGKPNRKQLSRFNKTISRVDEKARVWNGNRCSIIATVWIIVISPSVSCRLTTVFNMRWLIASIMPCQGSGSKTKERTLPGSGSRRDNDSEQFICSPEPIPDAPTTRPDTGSNLLHHDNSISLFQIPWQKKHSLKPKRICCRPVLENSV
jgi:hypothetical protein